jgi:27-O-demethylrifamycin SV methyltransferase
MTNRAALHYDAITEVWRRYIMGEELHFGLFAARETLEEGTRNLTAHLADCAELGADDHVLDAGCGVGAPARFLHDQYGCRVTGISTSQVGIDAAKAYASEHLEFLLRDATDTGFAPDTFDRIYSMESAHLMDKTRLFAECARVLRPGGRIALCDVVMIGNEAEELASYVMLGHAPKAAARFRDAVHELIHRAFGSTVLKHTDVYRDAALAAGLTDVELQDVSPSAKRTLHLWAENAAKNAEAIAAAAGQSYLDDFLLALLHMTHGWGRLGGYVVLTARKA